MRMEAKFPCHGGRRALGAWLIAIGGGGGVGAARAEPTNVTKASVAARRTVRCMMALLRPR